MTVPSIEPRSPIEPRAVSSAPDSLCCEAGRGVGVILPCLGPGVRHPHRAGCRKVALGLDCGEEGKGGEGQSVGLPFPTLHLLYPPASLPFTRETQEQWCPMLVLEFSAESGAGCNLPTSNVSISVGPGQGDSPVSPPHSTSISGYLWKTRGEVQSWTHTTQPRLWSGSGSWGSGSGG